jgi:hypothetical protein
MKLLFEMTHSLAAGGLSSDLRFHGGLLILPLSLKRQYASILAFKPYSAKKTAIELLIAGVRSWEADLGEIVDFCADGFLRRRH